MSTETMFWIFFNAFVLIMLALDLGVFHRKAHKVSFKESLTWTIVWISLAMIFNGIIYLWKGPVKSVEFFTGYLIELSLSVDNLFVFLLIFGYFKVPQEYQHRVLFWGIIGALVMRAIFIFAGIALINKFHWVIYVFAGVLIFSGIKMLFQKDKAIEPEKNPVVKLVRRLFPITRNYHGTHFFVRKKKILAATPLFVVLILVETTDLIFAVDSIPAILGITRDSFIVYTSNVFAILGLRSLYFTLAGIIQLFRFLNIGLALILVFIGVKMAIMDWYHIPIQYALFTVLGILLISILASILIKPSNTQKENTIGN
ncbi:MAG: TerC family protein [Bacteroidetes bacterium]|nr:MAG: TerC family protein [Bacteroidota bacterium]REK06468.1 MAG: TerC family protein [Bacteroidota bacterium]REK33234.1 MAG: TerC family protein [Bacteroidota bacterium]REK47071.1 MAG: TerC family protein [Bacteroidota bacterium]